MNRPHWSYIIPPTAMTEKFRTELAIAKYLVLEHCTAIEAYRLGAFTSFGDMRAYLKGREEAGYASTLIAVTRIDKTIIWPQIGTAMPLEDLLR